MTKWECKQNNKGNLSSAKIACFLSSKNILTTEYLFLFKFKNKGDSNKNMACRPTPLHASMIY